MHIQQMISTCRHCSHTVRFLQHASAYEDVIIPCMTLKIE